MFRSIPTKDTFKESTEAFRLAAEKFLQHTEFNEDEFPWAMVLFSVLGEMIKTNQHEPNDNLKRILSNCILKDLSFILSEGKFKDQEHCKEFAAAINTYVSILDHQQHSRNAEPALHNNWHIM